MDATQEYQSRNQCNARNPPGDCEPMRYQYSARNVPGVPQTDSAGLRAPKRDTDVVTTAATKG